MDVRIETLPDRRCVCVRHVGPYSAAALGPVFRRLSQWAVAHRRWRPQDRLIGLSYDDPRTVPASELRYDVCLTTADEDADLPDGLRFERIGGGRWAIHTLRGAYSGMPAVFHHLREIWLPASGEQRDDRAFMEIYLNDPSDVPEADLLTDVCVPLRGK